ncbi:MAG: HypC/HybG/HupF family hydrogenase formation chaperone [Bacteroidetes bacterium]|nr:HypC/HybG/HupF family hydrogenase formation chaperone [Bacteroidota bacterium]MBL6962942.1 HypC/HybG/HupF family hydrogenase formation chaperone [Bacteroidota bacterium]
MCLSVPAKVLEIHGEMAKVSLGGIEYEASLQIVEDIQVGDYVLLHTGYAIQKLSEEEAMETLKLFEELKELNKQIEEEEKDERGRTD